jgi:hypothetical protein
MSVRRRVFSVLAMLYVTMGVVVVGAGSAFADREYVPAGSFGEPCSGEPCGNGQFKEPAGVAVNTASESLSEPAGGDVYVIDAGDARVERFNAAGVHLSQFDGSGTPAKSFVFSPSQSSNGIAVDNSHSALDPSAGDVYVVDLGGKAIDKFTATGTYVSQITGTPSGSFGELYGVALDPAGNVWAYEGSRNVDEFSDTGGFIGQFNTGRGVLPGFAVDSRDDPYVVFGTEAVGKFVAGQEVAEFSGSTTAIAVDPATDDVLVDKAGSIDLYGPFAEPAQAPVQTFPGAGLGGSHGLAVGATGTAYASQQGTDKIDVFDYVRVFAASTGSASGPSETSAILHGGISTAGKTVTECRFEYGTEVSYGQSVPCAQTPTQITTAGETSEQVAVTAELSGLSPRAIYHFRLDVKDGEGEKSGQDESLYTGGHPIVGKESFTGLSSTGVTLSASVDPGGLPTGYRVEYGPTATYGSSTPEQSAGAGREPVSVLVQLNGLQPGVEYHYRFLAANTFGNTAGGDTTFTTPSSLGPAALTLPDERAYELVSPPNNPGEVYIPQGPFYPVEDIISAPMPFRASVEGNAVVYGGEAPAAGGTGGIGKGKGDQFLAVRGPSGWTARDIEPYQISAASKEGYQAFSNDLSMSIVRARSEPPRIPALTVDAPQCSGQVLYARATGEAAEDPYSALFTKAGASGDCGGPVFAGTSADDSHLLFQDQVALTPNAEEAPGTEQFCVLHCDLYDSVDGHPRLVNVLPHGETAPNAVFGGPGPRDTEPEIVAQEPDFSNVVSADGSRIFWTDLNTNLVYMRENGTRTVQVPAGAAVFWTASRDGRYVFYTEGGGLWRFNVEVFDNSSKPEAEALTEAREELAGEGAGVQGVVGTSDDGSYVYFAALGALSPEAKPLSSCKRASIEREEKVKEGKFEDIARLDEERREEEEGLRPTNRGCNLYVLHIGQPVRFIGALGAGDDDRLPGGSSGGGNPVHGGNWTASLGFRAAEVTPDGRHLVFESRLSRSLVGYNNSSREAAEVEIFVFDAGTGHISCASCAPSGAPPSSAISGFSEFGTFLPVTSNSTFMRRWVSEDGSRIFFDTAQPLVAQDTNGVQDVYEWEREGTSGCSSQVPARLDGGCVSLLSGGSGTDWSWLVDASGNGDDVFFITRSQLVARDGNEKMDLYDARVNGGFAEVEQSCTGSGCQGVPPAPPIFATPSSVTFSGVGNFEPPSKVAVKPRRKVVKCKRGFVKKHGRCAKKAARRSGGRSKRRGR